MSTNHLSKYSKFVVLAYMQGGIVMVQGDEQRHAVFPTQPLAEALTVEIKNAVMKKNTPREELKNELLTRTQGSNTWKSRRFKANENNLPRFLREALSELDSLA